MTKTKNVILEITENIELDFPFHNYKEYQGCASLLELSSHQSDLNHSSQGSRVERLWGLV